MVGKVALHMYLLLRPPLPWLSSHPAALKGWELVNSWGISSDPPPPQTTVTGPMRTAS